MECLSDRVVECISAKVRFKGDFINGADNYTWPKIQCNWVRLQEINPQSLTFEMSKTKI